MKKIIFLIIITVSANTAALGNIVVLKTGEKFEGQIAKHTEKYIEIDLDLGILITYYLDEIETIDGKKIILISEDSNMKKAEKEKLQLKPYKYFSEDNELEIKPQPSE